MRHAILGAGGVGGLIAAALAKSGDDVTLLLKPHAIKNYPQSISLESSFGSFSVAVQKATTVTEPFDVVWVTVKATQLESALEAIGAPQDIGALVPLLNGIDHIPLLRSRFGHDLVVPATIGVESERIAPGKFVHGSPGVRLSVAAMGESRLGLTLDKLRSFGFTCQFVADEQKLLWGKLAFLAPCALVTTASGFTAGEMNSSPEWRKRAEICVREACSVAAAQGTQLDAASFIRFFDSLPTGMRSSMQKDFAAGNALELGAIAGPILRGAEEYGLAVPATRELVDRIQTMVHGKSGAAAQR